VATLDRIEKHRDHLYFSNLSYLIIDELDTLIDSNFSEQLEKFIDAVKKRQLKAKDSGGFTPKIILVSATFTKSIDTFFNHCFRYYERDPKFYTEA
jgi:superfamily II DNA/RNA helicase